jgi:hypothetical protein
MRRTAVVLALAVILFSGCAAHPVASPSQAAKAVPSPTTTASVPAVVLPTDCTTVVAPDVYAKELAATPLDDPAFIAADAANAVTPAKPKPGATSTQKLAAAVELRCVWRDPAADATGMTLTEAHVDVDAATSFLSQAKLLHWNCADTHGGRECQKAEQSRKHPVATLHTVFLRDDVFIEVTQSNFITNDIVGSIVATLWPR